MIRVLEVLVSLLIVFLLAVLVGVFLPDHGHIERSVVVSNPLRQVYDSMNTFHRFPQWAAIRGNDPNMQINYEGPVSGPGAKVVWKSSDPDVGNGDLEIVDSEQDSDIRMAIDNVWSGANKRFTITLTPSQNGKTVTINWAYDTDYGWNLLWRFNGMYINGEPATNIQVNLNNIAAMLSTFPIVDYAGQDIEVAEASAQPMLVVATQAPRTLDDVAEATDVALAQIEVVLEKAGLTEAGPRRIITTNWGDENYSYDVAVPVNSASFSINGQSFTITAPSNRVSGLSTEDDTSDAMSGNNDDENDNGTKPLELTPGNRDTRGYLVIDDKVRGIQSYRGEALVTSYTGSPAALPLLRLMLKAYAETHGYPYSEVAEGRIWDELITPADTAAEIEDTYKVYLPIQTP